MLFSRLKSANSNPRIMNKLKFTDLQFTKNLTNLPGWSYW